MTVGKMIRRCICNTSEIIFRAKTSKMEFFRKITNGWKQKKPTKQTLKNKNTPSEIFDWVLTTLDAFEAFLAALLRCPFNIWYWFTISVSVEKTKSWQFWKSFHMVPFEKKHKKIIKIPKKTFEMWLNLNVATGPIPETLFKILNVFLGNFQTL